MLTILLVGCAGETPSPTDTGTISATSPPLWSAEEATAQVQAWDEVVLPTAADAVAAYLYALSNGDDSCPGSDTQLTESVLYGCTAESGWRYAGVASYGGDEDGYWLGGDFELWDPDGQTYSAGGGLSHQVTEMETALVWVMEIGGTWVWPAAEGWLGEGTSAVYQIVGGREETVELEITGGVTLAGQSVDFLLAWSELGCWEQPTGEVKVRDEAGAWYRLVLEDCTGCGSIIYGTGEVLGEGCVSLTNLRDFALSAETLPVVK